MKRALAYLIIFLFSLLFHGVYKSNPHLVDTIAYTCLGICYGYLAYKIASWIHSTTKNKQEDE